MQGIISDTESSVQRRRHRSRRRKVAESVALILGVPLLLALVLGLSVELIEYRPIGDPNVADPLPSRSVGHALGLQGRRLPEAVVDIPPIEIDAD
jgi:hypothetical protein